MSVVFVKLMDPIVIVSWRLLMVFTASESDVVMMLILTGPLPLRGWGALDQGMVDLVPNK